MLKCVKQAAKPAFSGLFLYVIGCGPLVQWSLSPGSQSPPLGGGHGSGLDFCARTQRAEIVVTWQQAGTRSVRKHRPRDVWALLFCSFVSSCSYDLPSLRGNSVALNSTLSHIKTQFQLSLQQIIGAAVGFYPY
jgi:hypothetical protein